MTLCTTRFAVFCDIVKHCLDPDGQFLNANFIERNEKDNSGMHFLMINDRYVRVDLLQYHHTGYRYAYVQSIFCEHLKKQFLCALMFRFIMEMRETDDTHFVIDTRSRRVWSVREHACFAGRSTSWFRPQQLNRKKRKRILQKWMQPKAQQQFLKQQLWRWHKNLCQNFSILKKACKLRKAYYSKTNARETCERIQNNIVFLFNQESFCTFL